ncbi:MULTISPECIES: TrlF family AAA-like ATPase [Micrococcus]|uniref:Chromosome segregation protein SMC n=1 Tax=Micrococcus luteus TaxID=1270 RepID=A0AAP3EV25_MICLU|nr:chromosome segregation protein SMC [Micrococcus luteus]MCV7629873.1 chromosome segregation protein SMC [Micrococcus luteus]
MTTAGLERARGTAWRIWDLHVHTPASIVQHYGDHSAETWSRFISELESLPEDITVIGINDYWFLDGYKRVVEARKSGRLQNLEAIFPVIEMRLDQFGGTDGDLSRVNLHVIFDPDLEPEVIQAQFINALQPKMKLSPGCSSIPWQGVITRESLTNLGHRIKETIPADHLSNYDSDLREGFNNLNVGLEDVQEILAGPYFKNRALIGIGKTEWRDIKWNDQSIAAKKNVINSAQFIFTAYEDTARWQADVEELRHSNVTHQLLDCSDAHYFSDSDQHMRLGACQTWLNTTPTLAGLAYAIKEFDRRVFVGLEPPALARMRKNPERFIDKIRVGSENEDRDLFNHDLALNSGFVAVVGNKGQGKSALLDCIALGGNSSRNSEFAFLSPTRFLSAQNQKVAKDYHTEIVWATGAARQAPLNQGHDKAAPVLVEYLPQMFVERVCNPDPGADADEFERELRTVLFTHIPEDERAGEKTFDALLAQKTRTSQDDLTRLREELRSAVRGYVAIAAFRASNQASEVQSRLDLKQADIDAANKDLYTAKAALADIDTASKDNGHLTELMQRSEEIEALRSELTTRRSANEQQQANSRQRLGKMKAIAHRAEAIKADVATLNSEAEALLDDAETDSPYIDLTVNDGRYQAWLKKEEESLVDLTRERDQIDQDLEVQEKARLENAEALAAADSARERARQRALQSEERVRTLVGDEDDEESHAGLSSLLRRIDEAPAKMSELRDEMMLCSRRVYEALEAQLHAVEGLYAPASTFIAQSDVVKNAGLEFNAELRILPGWRSVAASLHGRKNGEFSDWLMELPQRVEDTSWTQLATQLQESLDRLEHERGEVSGEYRDPAAALRTNTTVEDFLMSMFDLSWLEVRFGLTGDGLPLSQLSPGQRGLVLALFYLVVDLRTTPLLLDQPEENLDNETIASKLVPAIHEAAGRRQTIVVTHNANLAIVGDADQIVHCQMNDRRFTVNSGSIAELDVTKFALDVLEGTKQAFDNRRHKYEAFPELP